MIARHLFVEVLLSPEIMDTFGAQQAMFYESPADVKDGLSQAAKRDLIMPYIFRHIKDVLTDRQALCLRLHYLSGLSCRDVARTIGLHQSTVSQHVRAGIAKLRKSGRLRKTYDDAMRDEERRDK